MKRFIATLLSVAMLLSVTMTNAFAISNGEPEDPFEASLDTGNQVYPETEIEGHFEEQASLPNGIRLYSENIPVGQEDNQVNLLNLDRETEENEGGPTAYGVLANAGDIASYTLEVDHDVFPEIVLGFYRYCTVNNFTATVRTESTQEAISINTAPFGSTSRISARRFLKFSKPEGGIETYTITIKASEPATGYAFIVSTPDTFVDDFSGMNSFTTAVKNIPTEELKELGITQYMMSYQALLNGGGDWYHYIADGETYITASILNWTHLAFSVYDLDTGMLVYRSNEQQDNVIRASSDTLYTGYVQKRLDLEPGKDYLIGFYNTAYKQIDYDYYNIWIGLPDIEMTKIEYTSPLYRIGANQTKTFNFKLSDYPKSMRVDTSTLFYGTGENKYFDNNVRSCQITAPNGYTFSAPQGYISGITKIKLDDYLNNPSNIPINGTWKVTVTTSQAIPNWRFSISGYVSAIVGNDGN